MRTEPPRVLIVEDDEMTSQAMYKFFHIWGWNAVKAFTVKEALARLGDPFDLITLDLSLPDGSGIAVLRAVRDRKLETPVVVTTASDISGLAEVQSLKPDKLYLKPYVWDAVSDYAAAIQLKLRSED